MAKGLFHSGLLILPQDSILVFYRNVKLQIKYILRLKLHTLLGRPGVLMTTTSSNSLPINPRAIGELTEIKFSLMFASSSPTMRYFALLQYPH